MTDESQYLTTCNDAFDFDFNEIADLIERTYLTKGETP